MEGESFMKLKKENKIGIIISAIVLIAMAAVYFLLKPQSTVVQFFVGLLGGISVVTLFVFIMDIKPPEDKKHKR